MEIWKKEWQEMDNIDQTSIFYRLSDTTTKVLGDHTGEELVADGVSPILYSRALEELAETNKEESPQQYDAWYSRQRERFETFVEAYRKKLDLPPRHPVLEMFANFKVHEGIAI
ncbi:uncharacterized protein PHALS_14268 [Plasmopara halstedii]|uniref:Uncharacterized protein n=1 Tax=Plasmopara halstedii TaxID=4781 RepID=A0A0N7L6D8_PLAHL|nr:uncharacterized protein PHALS_14268 [Plasmopara halstedii]CEG43995.1 hypothetical protein PHALS_14268 [Plasmopara halstedii]|eukprot:XP_024580364.1 hypothetical protein PHALS_14268 [Plasmopara halstedii]